MKLSDITEKTPLVKDFSKRLAKSTKQAIAILEVEKVKRVSGASVRPVNMVLENGQTVKIYLRLAAEDGALDLIRMDINGKNVPLTGDFDNSYKPSFEQSVDGVANIINTGQKAFQAKRAKMKVKRPTTTGKPPMNKAQQKAALFETAKELDTVIATKTTEKQTLQAQLAQLTDTK